jgi:hypothetical protein
MLNPTSDDLKHGARRVREGAQGGRSTISYSQALAEYVVLGVASNGHGQHHRFARLDHAIAAANRIAFGPLLPGERYPD